MDRHDIGREIIYKLLTGSKEGEDINATFASELSTVCECVQLLKNHGTKFEDFHIHDRHDLLEHLFHLKTRIVRMNGLMLLHGKYYYGHETAQNANDQNLTVLLYISNLLSYD